MNELKPLISNIAAKLIQCNWTLATAESATGGYIGYQITTVPGSSAYFIGGVIAYSNDVKFDVLGVNREPLDRWGAVSAPVAMDMASGACQVTGADVGISITGIAGPGGATEYKPVGLYFMGLAVPGARYSWRHVFDADRAGNNHLAAQTILQHLDAYLAGQ